MKVCVVIPVRLESERYPGKALEMFQGKTLIENTIGIAKRLDFIDKIVVCSGTESLLLRTICKEQDVEYLYTDKQVSCGTERVMIVKDKYTYYDYYMTIPIDEPVINPDELNEWHKNKSSETSFVTTFYCSFFNKSDLVSNNSCKVITDRGFIMYTSRSVIPGSKRQKRKLLEFKKHVGVFIFPTEMVCKSTWSPSESAEIESLEQNMFILEGLMAYRIKHIGIGIDKPGDIELLEERMKKNEKKYSVV